MYIRIEDSLIQTKIIDGVQRLPNDPLLHYLWKCGALDLNKLAANSRTAEDIDMRRLFYLNFGYSVCGYQELFPDDDIDNPLWYPYEHMGFCKHCGCEDDHCPDCIARTGEPCHWVGPNLCSACADLEDGQ